MFTKQTIRNIDLQGKTVLLRAELDAPLSEDGKEVISDFRLKSNVPTIQFLLGKNCKIIIIGKLGRPGGKPVATMSLAPVAKRLEEIIGRPVGFVTDCIGDVVKTAAAGLKPGDIILLENVRFHAEEDEDDKDFAQSMADDSGADVFVQDCFASAHHPGASIDAITHFLPSVAGLSIEKEVDTLTTVVEKPKRPLMAVIGGAKIADKLEVMQRFIANTFLKAQGVDIGDSLYDKAEVKVAKDLMKQAAAETEKRPFRFIIPHDVVVADKVDKTASTRIVELAYPTIADIQHYPGQVPPTASHIHAHEKILDIGPSSASFIAGVVQLASTVVWSGTMGVTETPGMQGDIGPTAHGTQTVIQAMIGEFGHKPFSVLGGGDTVGYVQSRKLTDAFNHVSTGGSASLEVLAGHKLPGVEALMDKK
jgi:phosphoglycerate kinase